MRKLLGVFIRHEKKAQRARYIYQQQTNESRAQILTNEAKQLLNSLDKILINGVQFFMVLKWDDLYDKSDYSVPKPIQQPFPKKGCLAEILPSENKKYLDEIQRLTSQYNNLLADWNINREKYLQELKTRYSQKEVGAILKVNKLILDNSEYPINFEKYFVIDYNPRNMIMTIDYQLPSPEIIPRVKEVH